METHSIVSQIRRNQMISYNSVDKLYTHQIILSNTTDIPTLFNHESRASKLDFNPHAHYDIKYTYEDAVDHPRIISIVEHKNCVIF